MAAVATINGQEINQSNAYQFYYDICHDKYDGIDPKGPEAKQCRSFSVLNKYSIVRLMIRIM